jgi:hypothetical protein
MSTTTNPPFVPYIDERQILAAAAVDGVLDAVQAVLVSGGNGYVATPYRLYIVWPLAGEMLLLDFFEPFGWIRTLDVLPQIIGGNATLIPFLSWPQAA